MIPIFIPLKFKCCGTKYKTTVRFFLLRFLQSFKNVFFPALYPSLTLETGSAPAEATVSSPRPRASQDRVCP